VNWSLQIIHRVVIQKQALNVLLDDLLRNMQVPLQDLAHRPAQTYPDLHPLPEQGVKYPSLLAGHSYSYLHILSIKEGGRLPPAALWLF
jgi:hypothetical protein